LNNGDYKNEGHQGEKTGREWRARRKNTTGAEKGVEGMEREREGKKGVVS